VPAEFKSFTSVQLVPSYTSALALSPPFAPPAIMDAELTNPAPLKVFLAVFISAPSDHDVPFQYSVLSVVAGVSPPA